MESASLGLEVLVYSRFLVWSINYPFIQSIIRSIRTRRAKTKTTSLELQPKESDSEVKPGEGIGNATYIKVKILKAMKSPHPHEGKEYCIKLYEEVKNDRFGGKESEAGEQFNGINDTEVLH